MSRDNDENRAMDIEGRRFLNQHTDRTERLVLRIAKTSSLDAVLALMLTTPPKPAGDFGPFVFRTAMGDVTLDWADLHDVERNLMERRLSLLTAGIPCPPSVLFFDERDGTPMTVATIFKHLSETPRHRDHPLD